MMRFLNGDRAAEETEKSTHLLTITIKIVTLPNAYNAWPTKTTIIIKVEINTTKTVTQSKSNNYGHFLARIRIPIFFASPFYCSIQY